MADINRQSKNPVHFECTGFLYYINIIKLAAITIIPATMP